MTQLAVHRRRRRWYTYLGFLFVLASVVAQTVGFDDLAWPIWSVGLLLLLLAAEHAGWVKGYESARQDQERSIDEWIDR